MAEAIDPTVMNHLIGAMQHELDAPKDIPESLKSVRRNRALDDMRDLVPVEMAQVIAQPRMPATEASDLAEKLAKGEK